MAVNDHLEALEVLVDELDEADRVIREVAEKVPVLCRKIRARIRAIRREQLELVVGE